MNSESALVGRYRDRGYVIRSSKAGEDRGCLMVLQDKRSEASVEAVRVVVILLLQMKVAPTAAGAETAATAARRRQRRPHCSCSNV